MQKVKTKATLVHSNYCCSNIYLFACVINNIPKFLPKQQILI
jgi:hypothetical protein